MDPVLVGYFLIFLLIHLGKGLACSTGSAGVTSCYGLADGSYQDCSSCTSFVMCSNHVMTMDECPDYTYWDDIKKYCDYTSVTCKLISSTSVGRSTTVKPTTMTIQGTTKPKTTSKSEASSTTKTRPTSEFLLSSSEKSKVTVNPSSGRVTKTSAISIVSSNFGLLSSTVSTGTTNSEPTMTPTSHSSDLPSTDPSTRPTAKRFKITTTLSTFETSKLSETNISGTSVNSNDSSAATTAFHTKVSSDLTHSSSQEHKDETTDRGTTKTTEIVNSSQQDVGISTINIEGTTALKSTPFSSEGINETLFQVCTELFSHRLINTTSSVTSSTSPKPSSSTSSRSVSVKPGDVGSSSNSDDALRIVTPVFTDSDRRPSHIAIGTVGAACAVLPFAIFFVLDLPKLLQHLGFMVNNLGLLRKNKTRPS